MFQNGVKGAYDAMALHPYRYPHAPEEAHNDRDPRAPDKWPVLKTMAAVRDLRQRMATLTSPWITEFGYPTHTGTQGPGTMGDEFAEPAKGAPRTKAAKNAPKQAAKIFARRNGNGTRRFPATHDLAVFSGRGRPLLLVHHDDAGEGPVRQRALVRHPASRLQPAPRVFRAQGSKRACPAGSVMARERFQSTPAYCAFVEASRRQERLGAVIAERGATRKQGFKIEGAIAESFDGLGEAVQATSFPAARPPSPLAGACSISSGLRRSSFPWMSPTMTSHVEVRMIRENLEGLPRFALPDGYSLRFYRPGDEAEWTRIHEDADHHNVITPQLFGASSATAKRNCRSGSGLCDDANGRVIGTATAWFNDNYHGLPWGRVHLVAIAEAYQGRGLGRALTSAVCQRFVELGHVRKYLTTEGVRIPAIKLYASFGFVPEIENEADRREWELIRAQGVEV